MKRFYLEKEDLEVLGKNLNEFYKVLDFTTVERYKFRESFGFITEIKKKNQLN